MSILLWIGTEANLSQKLAGELFSDRLNAIYSARTSSQALRQLRELRPDVIVLETFVCDSSSVTAIDLFDEIRSRAANMPVIVLSERCDCQTAAKIKREGAFAHIIKPFDPFRMRDVIAKAIQSNPERRIPVSVSAVNDHIQKAAEDEVDRVFSLSKAMNDVYSVISRIAQRDVPILILGELGTGKKLASRTIHQHSQRADKLFLPINCAAISKSILEAELFGQEEQMPDGTNSVRSGKFDQCDGGTIYLDEIGETSPSVQARLLKLIREGCFEPVGSSRTIHANVRVIASTTQNLDEMAVAGSFDANLLVLLNRTAIRMPALRERIEDLPRFVEHFIKVGNRELGRKISGITDEAMSVLTRHSWPGNIRELKKVIHDAIVETSDKLIGEESLPLYLTADPVIESQEKVDLVRMLSEHLQAGGKGIYRRMTKAMDRLILATVLRHVNGHQGMASELLGISRTTLRSKMQSAGITLERHVS